MPVFPTDDQTLQLLDKVLHPGPGAERTSVTDLVELYADMAGVPFHINDVVDALLTELRELRVLAGPTALAEARGRREAYEKARAAIRAELLGAPLNAPPQSQLTYVGGLARARRMVEALYQQAQDDEEQLVMDQ